MQYPQPSTFNGSGSGFRSYGQQSQNNLLRVTGPESAKAYSLPPNSNVVLFDADNPVFYIKSTDDSGFTTLRTFEFTEVNNQNNQSETQPTIYEDFKEMQQNMAKMQNDISTLKEFMEGLVN